MDKKKIMALLASYARSVLSAAVALYLARVALPDLGYSLVAAILPVVIRFINPNDPAFGRVPTAVEVDKALAEAKILKAPVAKKPTAKKPTAK